MNTTMTSGDAGLLDQTPEVAAEQNPYNWPTFTFHVQDGQPEEGTLVGGQMQSPRPGTGGPTP